MRKSLFSLSEHYKRRGERSHRRVTNNIQYNISMFFFSDLFSVIYAQCTVNIVQGGINTRLGMTIALISTGLWHTWRMALFDVTSSCWCFVFDAFLNIWYGSLQHRCRAWSFEKFVNWILNIGYHHFPYRLKIILGDHFFMWEIFCDSLSIWIDHKLSNEKFWFYFACELLQSNVKCVLFWKLDKMSDIFLY